MSAPIAQTASLNEPTIHLRDLMTLLGYDKFYNLRRQFELFVGKLSPAQNEHPYKSDIYIDPITRRSVKTYYLSKPLTIAFCMYSDISKGYEAVLTLLQPKPEVSYNSLVFQPTIPFIWLVQALGRSTASINRTIKLNLDRVQGTELEKHWCWKDGQRWFTPWFVANMMVCKADGMKLKALLTNLVETQQIESSVSQLLEAPRFPQ